MTTVAPEHVDAEPEEGMPTPGRALVRMSTEGPIVWFRCPRDRLYCGVPAKPSPPNSKGCSWDWNGDVANPSITPSVNCNGGGCGWHGFITNGEVK